MRTLVETSGALLARPLLSWARRGETAIYCQSRGVEFREHGLVIAADTVEERIIELQDKKGRLAAATLDAGAAVGSLAAEDLDYLFGD